MKTTPFQQILRSEMARIESVMYSNDRRIGGQIALTMTKSHAHPIKERHSLVHFLKYRIGF